MFECFFFVFFWIHKIIRNIQQKCENEIFLCILNFVLSSPRTIEIQFIHAIRIKVIFLVSVFLLFVLILIKKKGQQNVARGWLIGVLVIEFITFSVTLDGDDLRRVFSLSDGVFVLLWFESNGRFFRFLFEIVHFNITERRKYD